MSEHVWADDSFGAGGVAIHSDCPACVAAGELLDEAAKTRDQSAAADARIYLREHPDHRHTPGGEASR
ncbi:hypothetical protein [Streptomyces sp. NPDC059080]|uniref:hypothetical protein n=1 Tax=Streptomyces sp. NPDC059080 TaxID=3346718 RepID=UPI003691E93A